MQDKYYTSGFVQFCGEICLQRYRHGMKRSAKSPSCQGPLLLVPPTTSQAIVSDGQDSFRQVVATS